MIIETQGLTKTYKMGGAEVHALRGVSVNIAAGEFVAVMGASGGGKSTLIALLQRFYDLPSGRILIDGHDISRATQESLRQAIAVVPQDAPLLNQPVKSLCYTCHKKQEKEFDKINMHRPVAEGACTSCHQHRHAHQGQFADKPCASCHVNGVYRGTSRDCVGCHLTAYQQTKNPAHVAAGFPTTCDTCHRPTDTSFAQGRFVWGGIALAVGLLTLYSMSKIWLEGFWKPHPDKAYPASASGPRPVASYAAVASLTVLALALGLYPEPFVRYLEAATAPLWTTGGMP